MTNWRGICSESVSAFFSVNDYTGGGNGRRCMVQGVRELNGIDFSDTKKMFI